MENHEFCNSRTSYPGQIGDVDFGMICLPAPNTLAVFDSLLYTFADELVPAAACATFATASEGDGVIIENFEEGGN